VFDQVVFFQSVYSKSEMVMRETSDGYQVGLLIGDRKISNLRYADDIVLIATAA